MEQYKAGHSLEVPLTDGDKFEASMNYSRLSVCSSLLSEADFIDMLLFNRAAVSGTKLLRTEHVKMLATRQKKMYLLG